MSGSGRTEISVISRLTSWKRTAHRMLLRAATGLLHRAGFSVTESRYSANYLKRYNFQIGTFVDVGVFDGSPVFYALFRDRKMVLIDPLPGTQARVADQLVGVDYDFLAFAAGASEDTMTLNVRGPASSLLNRVGHNSSAQQVEVPVKPLDTMLANYTPPFGLKIDTEGFEMDVLRGATKTLAMTEFVFAEANIRRRFENSYKFSEMVHHMAQNGFEVAELIPHPGHNRLADILFVRLDGSHLNVDAIHVRQPGQR